MSETIEASSIVRTAKPIVFLRNCSRSLPYRFLKQDFPVFSTGILSALCIVDADILMEATPVGAHIRIPPFARGVEGSSAAHTCVSSFNVLIRNDLPTPPGPDINNLGGVG